MTMIAVETSSAQTIDAVAQAPRVNLIADIDQQQPNVPQPARQAEDTVERTVRRFRIGVEGGVGLDPELIEFGGHAAFGPIFIPAIEFRPGVEFGIGEVTTVFAINLDVLYLLPGTAGTRWRPYGGAGPNFTLSHQSFSATTDNNNRFDFSDTSFNDGFNFIAGVRNRNGAFFEMKATVYGVNNVRLLGGFNF
jgi:hypothetical protein